MIPLNMVSPGEQVQIVSIGAGWGLQRRLADMGLTPGLKVKVIRSHRFGALLLDVRGSRLALGRGLARKIMVKTEGE